MSTVLRTGDRVSTLLFNRTARLIVGSRGFNTRIVFEIQKVMNCASPTECKIKTYNLSDESRNYIEGLKGDKKIIFLEAGYDGDNKLIFSGDLYYSHSEREGADVITSFEVMPGLVAVQRAHVDIRGAKNDLEVYNQVLARMGVYGVKQGFFSAAAKAKLEQATHKSYSDSGMAVKIMDDIASRAGVKVSFDHFELNVHMPDEYENPGVVLLSPQTGMIGFSTKTNLGLIKVKSLLNPDLDPGRKVRIVSQSNGINGGLKGDLKVFKAKHVGDTREGNWYTEIEACAPGAPFGMAGFMQPGS